MPPFFGDLLSRHPLGDQGWARQEPQQPQQPQPQPQPQHSVPWAVRSVLEQDLVPLNLSISMALL